MRHGMTIVIGRQAELARIDAFLAGVPAGARALVIEGEPGMGKTTLWLAGVENAAERAWRVLSARPSDAEATFAFAGLGDLLEAADDDALARLPAPQQRALRVALLREVPEGRPPDPGTVAVALLNALRGLSQGGPVLIAVDDVQWLDGPSALALGFAIRRLRDEPIGVLLARRIVGNARLPLELDRRSAREPLDPIAVGPLDVGALGEILDARLDLRFPRPILRRIHDASSGNPLFAIELGRALGRDPAKLEAWADLPLPDELSSLLGEQLAGLSADTQDALAVVAALAHPTVELLVQAVDGPKDRWLQPALRAHILAIDDGQIRFTHPLRAAAARSGTSPARRREIHERLAAIMEDPEERARHLALAADGPDESTAAALDEAALLARGRGAPGAASELAALARRLTPADQPNDIRRRGLVEADFTNAAGDPLRARAVVESVLATCPPGSARAEALAMLGVTHYAGDWRAGVDFFRQALAEPRVDDRVRMRCEGLLTGALDSLGEVAEAMTHGRAELELAERCGDQVHVATALRGLARNQQRLTGRMPVDLIERSMTLEPIVRSARRVTEWPSVCFAEMLSWTDDIAAGVSKWEWLRQQAYERGEEHTLSWFMPFMIMYECVAGDWQLALDRVQEGYELALEGGQGASQADILADRALVEAHLGDAPAVRRDAAEARRLGAPVGALLAERTAAWALGLLELSLGNPAQAHNQLGPLVEDRRVAGVGEPGDLRFVPLEIEALIGIGRLADAEALLDWYEGLALASGRVHARAACDRGRGLLHAARGELELAIAALDTSRTRYAAIADPFGLSRTLLALGSVERRALHRRAARQTLKAALELFEGLGARLWAERARAELARIGGRHAVGDELTPSERQVAALVAEGRTNREVAAALVVTERTIEGHLSTIYAKLRIRSRAELAHRFTSGTEPPA
jgi:DNA-binding CsgD family transcriptional regulator